MVVPIQRAGYLRNTGVPISAPTMVRTTIRMSGFLQSTLGSRSRSRQRAGVALLRMFVYELPRPANAQRMIRRGWELGVIATVRTGGEAPRHHPQLRRWFGATTRAPPPVRFRTRDVALHGRSSLSCSS